jgi:hypothetical protein
VLPVFLAGRACALDIIGGSTTWNRVLGVDFWANTSSFESKEVRERWAQDGWEATEDGIDEFVYIKICFTDPEVWVKALQQAPNTKVGIAPNSVVSLIAGMRSGHGLGPWKSSAFTAEGLGIGFVEIHEFHVYRCCLLREWVGFRS